MNKKFLSTIACCGLMVLASATCCHAVGELTPIEEELKTVCENYQSNDNTQEDPKTVCKNYREFSYNDR